MHTRSAKKTRLLIIMAELKNIVQTLRFSDFVVEMSHKNLSWFYTGQKEHLETKEFLSISILCPLKLANP